MTRGRRALTTLGVTAALMGVGAGAAQAWTIGQRTTYCPSSSACTTYQVTSISADKDPRGCHDWRIITLTKVPGQNTSAPLTRTEQQHMSFGC